MELRDLWLHLLAQVEHILGECRRPAAQRLFRSHGPRRLRMALRLLEQERAALLKVGVEWGLVATAAEASRPALQRVLCDDLVDDYLALADSYRRAAQIAESRGDAARARWLHGRAAIHASQGRFLQG